ncbi:hypothetical protein QE152_g25436 [Popillia japonica]|uniref:Uncharacterized protein n=1 Tax=Popillia japonica TaxID=7064 RepID=A0AAW1K044_POPJA
MADPNEVPGPSAAKRSRCNKIVSEAELLRLLENSDVESEDEGWCPADGALQDTDESELKLENVEPAEDGEEDTPQNIPEVTPQVTKVTPNTNIVLKSIPHGMGTFEFTKREELLIRPTDNNPIDYFSLLVTDEFLQVIVDETNSNAEQIFLSYGVTRV